MCREPFAFAPAKTLVAFAVGCEARDLPRGETALALARPRQRCYRTLTLIEADMTAAAKPRMPGWGMALMVSAAWVAVVVAVGYTHTDVILAGKISDAEDAAISEIYGIVCGLAWISQADGRIGRANQ